MSKQLHVLIVEDNEMDSVLLTRELQRGGYELDVQRVDTPERMQVALEKKSWDLVLCDYTMPRFNAPEALSQVRKSQPDVPFIIISGTVGEETAVESMRAGAQDFIVKGSLRRLLSAIERELTASALRAESKKMREQLLTSDRMESIGMLATSVAHEINNSLTVILGNLELIANNLSEDFAKARNGLQGMQNDTEALLLGSQEAAERVRGVARDLKVFSHTELQPIVHETLDKKVAPKANLAARA